MDSATAKTALLAAALAEIPFDGWEAAVRNRPLHEVYFPRGAIDAIAWHSRLADTAMAEAVAALPLEQMRIPQKVRAAIMHRLRAALPEREAVRKALAILAFPTHAAESLALLHATVDTIWKSIGDRSHDFNWYTKRATLAGIYSATLFLWLNDESENLSETEAFLDRRLGDLHRFGQWKKRCTEFLGRIAIHARP